VLTGAEAERAEKLARQIDKARQAGKVEEAQTLARSVLEIRACVQGADHWQTGDARRLVQLLERIAALPRAAQTELSRVTKLHEEALGLARGGHYTEALARVQRALEVHRQYLGEEDSEAAALNHALGVLFMKSGKSAAAEPPLQQALALRRRVLGEDHPHTGHSYHSLALALDAQGKYKAAAVFHRKALVICQKAVGEDDPQMALSWNSLASSLHVQGEYARAAALYEKALAILLRARGEDHPWTAAAYNNLAFNLTAQGKHTAAAALLHKALAIQRRLLGEDHPDTALAYNNLALSLGAQGNDAAAAPLFEKALAIRRRVLAADHPDIAQSYNNLAATLDVLGNHAAAAPLHEKALAICHKTLGADHPFTAQSYSNLALNLSRQQRYAAATPFYEKALAVRRQALGENHPDTTRSYLNLARNLWALGRFPEAEKHWRAAAQSFEAARLRVQFTGLERAPFAAERSPLLGLAACAARAGKVEDAWQHCEAHLARGLLDDLAARPLTADEQTRQQELRGKLTRLDRQIAALLSTKAARATGGADVDELQKQRSTWQAALTQFEAELAARYDLAAGAVYDRERIQKCLPADAALVVWIDLKSPPGAADPNGEHWGCVVRRRGTPVWVRLPGSGRGGAWTDDNDRLPARVGRAVSSRPLGPNDDGKHLIQRLHAQRLAPLEKHFKDPEVKRLIVLPSAGMAGIPIEVLTDRYTVSYAPSATVFALLQGKRAQGRGHPSSSLLAVGDPVFVRPESGHQHAFAPLPGTRREVEAIAGLFDKADRLLGSEASEQQLAEWAAAGRLRGYRYLHLATHAVLDHERPLQSALILAQDRLPDPLEQIRAGKECYDGRLTAEQIRRTWKLDAELVTLSACQTGLGKYQGGEGFLGFSQALFLAGARSVVLSQWKVDDEVTALLMRRFYQNLLGKREGLKGLLPRAEALREAQRWLRGLTAGEAAKLTGADRGREEARKPAPAPHSAHPYAHPYYWAAFILIGDPN
jgi:CHAT domain-containing protein/tetratricopeptide (TPR) repeat protein